MEFSYIRPRNLAEALRALADVPGTRLVAGGTDLVPALRDRAIRPPALVDVSELKELRLVVSGQDGLEIGAACRLAEIERDERIPAVLRKACALVGTPQVRNLATVGGNVCNASPAGDTITPLLALDAVVKVRSTSGLRTIPLTELFVGPKKTTLGSQELVVAFGVPKEAAARGGGFEKIGRRREVVISQVNVAVTVAIKENGAIEVIRLAVGSVAPTALRLKAVEDRLCGQTPSPGLAEEAGRLVAQEIKPISDVRATAEYRRRVIAVLSRRALTTALREAGVSGL